MSKPKSNSILDNLSASQKSQLETWLFEENISYKDASARLLADFEVRCLPSSIGEWYQRIAQRRMLDRIAASQALKNSVVDKFKANPADTYNALLEMAGQIAFEKAMNGDKELDAETIFNFTKLVMTGRKQAMEAEHLALDKRRLELLEKKAEQLDKAKAVVESKLTPEEKMTRVKSIFGMS